MYFRRIIIKNLLCHKYLDVALQRGLIGIFGKNGRGKSTLLNLMYAVLTNDFSRFPGTRAECINNTSEKRDEAYVYGEVEHGEHVLKIRRGLRQPAKSSLVVDEEPEITDANKIKERLEEILGLTTDMLDLFVFKQQDKLYDIFVATDAKRREAYQTLNRTEKCEVVYEALGKQLEEDQKALDGFVDNSDDLLSSQESVESALDELDAELKKQTKLMLSEESLASADQITADWRKRSELLDELTEAENAVEKAHAERKAANEREMKLLGAIETGERYLVDNKADYTSATAALSQFDQYEKNRRRRNELADEKEELANEAAELVKPAEPKDYAKYDEKKAAALKVSFENELKAAKSMLADYDATGVSKCETCGTVLARADTTLLEKNKLILKNNPPEIKKLGDWLNSIAEYDRKVRNYETAKADLDARVKANAAAIKAFEELKQPKGNKEDLQQIVKDYESVETDLATTRRGQKRIADNAATARADYDTKAKTVKDLNAKLDAIEAKVTKEKYEKVKTRMAEHDAARDRAAELKGEIRTKETRLKEIKADLDAVKAKAKRLKRLRATIATLQRAREVTHRNGLPTRVSQTNLVRLEGYVNDELELFGNPFWIETGEDLQFIVHKPGEPAQTATWLSTGWKCVLAGAFWMTLVSVWTDGGLLCLDEPTANLDEDNRAFLAEALSRLTGRIRGNRQVIMVSHAEELRSSFDQVIDLGIENAEKTG